MNKTYYDITTEYPDSYKVVVYKDPYTPNPSEEKAKPKPGLSIDDSSIRRTKRILHDYVKCNDFNLFVTFTLDPRKINRYDPRIVYPKVQSWLRRQHQKDPSFKYLIVPEHHKDKAIHFHALMQNAPLELKKTNIIQDRKRIYNIPGFPFGFTNATKLDAADKAKAGNYIAKYITKDMITVSNKRRYWASKNLAKPTKHYNKLYDLELHHRISAINVIHETEYNTIYIVDKHL